MKKEKTFWTPYRLWLLIGNIILFSFPIWKEIMLLKNYLPLFLALYIIGGISIILSFKINFNLENRVGVKK